MKSLLTALVTVLAVATFGAPADGAAARHPKPKVTVTGWRLQTSDHNDYQDGAIPVADNGSYTEGCDGILYIDAMVTAKHVKKNTGYSWRTTYNGVTQYAYAQAWTTSGKVTLEDEAMKTPNQSGTLTFTLKMRHKVVARGSLHIVVAGCTFQ